MVPIIEHGTWRLEPGDEGPHPVGSEQLWNESWYWAYLVRNGAPLVLVADNDAPLPDAGHGGPEGADSRLVTAGGVYPYRAMSRYEVPASVDGTIRLGDEHIRFSGYGERDHSWGERDWWNLSWLWTAGRLHDGTAFHGVQANLGFALAWPSFLRVPDGTLSHRDGFRAATRFGPDDFPAFSELALGGLDLTVTPPHFAPVVMTSPDGRLAHFPRAMCRFEAADGRAGYRWTEWHRPPGWQRHDWTAAQAGTLRQEPTT